MKFKKTLKWMALAVTAVVVVLGCKIAENENRCTKVIHEVKSCLGL